MILEPPNPKPPFPKTPRNTYGLEKYFIEIEDWLAKKPSEEDNVPLIIEADEGVSKKTLLVKWIHYHLKANGKVNLYPLKTQKNYNDIVIPHFASAGGNNSNYFYTIYRILIKLRVFFPLPQS